VARTEQELLRAYDAQLRGVLHANLPDGVRVEEDGPLLRFVGYDHGGFIGYRDLGGIEGGELDGLISRQVSYFAERGERFEWKLHAHDRPADLAEHLIAAGFEPEEVEAVLVASVSRIASEPVPPEGVVLREVSDISDLERIAAMEEEVWHDGRAWVAAGLHAEISADPAAITVVVAESGDQVVCAGWVRFAAGTDFASLWGGSTLPTWRGRGIYRALVAHRANLAAARGLKYLQVDASPDSRPILERLGFVQITTTTPYIWTPLAAQPG
jgi:GNAT superfamily N-acetyltransferase